MKKISEKIIFFGSGPVAAKSLKLLNDVFDIEAVITKPAKTRKNDPVPVIDLCKELNIKFFLTSNKIELDKLLQQKIIKSRLAILIDFGIIISQNAIDYFPLGIINSHFSLLPKWRGADPITFSILSGEKETGVSLMLLTSGMDEGPLLAQKSITLTEFTTTSLLTDELILLSDELLKEYVPKYLSKEISTFEQPLNIPISYSRKLTKQDGLIDWSKSAIKIEREIRAYNEWPKSYTNINGKLIIIVKAELFNDNGKAGDWLVKDGQLIFYCGEGALSIKKLKPSGKNEMNIIAFLAGYRSLISN